MVINTTSKKKPAEDGNPMAGAAINDLDCPTAERPEKVFLQLRAAFSLIGHALYRSDPQDGVVTYWIERSGQVKQLPTIDAVRSFLASTRQRPPHG